jgi:hypothetical protein
MKREKDERQDAKKTSLEMPSCFKNQRTCSSCSCSCERRIAVFSNEELRAIFILIRPSVWGRLLNFVGADLYNWSQKFIFTNLKFPS